MTKQRKQGAHIIYTCEPFTDNNHDNGYVFTRSEYCHDNGYTTKWIHHFSKNWKYEQTTIKERRYNILDDSNGVATLAGLDEPAIALKHLGQGMLVKAQELIEEEV